MRTSQSSSALHLVLTEAGTKLESLIWNASQEGLPHGWAKLGFWASLSLRAPVFGLPWILA